MNDKAESQGRAVILPNGKARIDFIRDHYYGPLGGKTHTHTDKCKSRGEIKKLINDMLPEGQEIAYQIVYAATKKGDVTDPRVAAKARAAERAKAKKDKEAAELKAKKEAEAKTKREAAAAAKKAK